MEKASRLNPDKSWSELSIVLTDDEGISQLHKEFLNKPGSTDVISFCYDPLPGGEEGYTGELIINVQCAEREGSRRKGSTPSSELALYIAHGCDHLYDQEDYDDEGRTRMRRRELRWLKQLDHQGIVT